MPTWRSPFLSLEGNATVRPLFRHAPHLSAPADDKTVQARLIMQ
jgi:hypothetical protein